MPFALITSGAEFRKCKDHIMRHLVHDFVTMHIDDIRIMSESLEEHYNHLKQVFTWFKEHNVTVNREKSQFFLQQVKFLDV